jgi:hypothetical protein
MRIGVIGAGPVGIYFSKLCLDLGFKVTLIEAGGIAEESLHLNRSKYIFTSQSAMPEGVHKIGGGSNLWRGRISEFISEDFTKQFENLNCSWPFSKDELIPVYKKLYQFLEAGNLRDTEIISTKIPDIEHSLPKEFLLRCFRYCRPDFFIDVFNSIINHSNLEILSKHYCQSVSQNLTTNTLSVQLIPESFKTFSREFNKIVLTCGSLQTTALLMRSRDLAPKSDYPALGKYLSEHVEGYIGTVTIKNKLEKNIFKRISLDRNNRTLYDYNGIGFALNLKNTQDKENLNVQYEIRKLMPKPYFFGSIELKNRDFEKLLPITMKLMLLGEKSLSRSLRLFQHVTRRILRKSKYSVYIKSEEIPFIESEVKIDELDESIVRYDHKISEKTFILLRNNIFEFQKVFNKYFDAKIVLDKNIFDIDNFKSLFGPNWHPMGTTRIGNDALTSVCNSNLQVHNIDKLFILSSSVFPSVSNTNPTFTVLALADRLANSQTFLE